MVTLNDALMELVKKKLVAPEEAYVEGGRQDGVRGDAQARWESTRSSRRPQKRGSERRDRHERRDGLDGPGSSLQPIPHFQPKSEEEPGAQLQLAWVADAGMNPAGVLNSALRPLPV